MTLFLLNAMLAVGWCALFGSFSLGMLAVGYAVGYGCLFLTRSLYGSTTYFGRFWRVISLVAYFLYDLVASSLRVVWDILTPVIHARPGIVAVPLDAKTDVEITLVANLISLTPGTLSLDVSPDCKTLYVHAMFIDDPEKPEAIAADLKAGMERKVLEVTR